MQIKQLKPLIAALLIIGAVCINGIENFKIREMKEKHIETINTEITCDNPKCDFKDVVKDGNYESWLNKPCPKCGENLLTEYDYGLWKKLRNSVNIINSLDESQLEKLAELAKDNPIYKDLIESGGKNIRVKCHNGIEFKSNN